MKGLFPNFDDSYLCLTTHRASIRAQNLNVRKWSNLKHVDVDELCFTTGKHWPHYRSRKWRCGKWVSCE